MLSHCISIIILAFLATVSATEHIVIIDQRDAGTPDIAGVLQRIGLDLDHQNVSAIWNNTAFAGFVATVQKKHIGCLQNMTEVLIVEKSINVAHTGVIRHSQRDTQSYTRGNATWGLDRISNAFFQGSDAYTMGYTYQYQDKSLGNGADIYILDSGIWTEHHGFEGRAQMIWSFDGNMTDMGGHGTHVAGTAGAVDFGVASNANLWGLRVLGENGAGSTATVIAGIDHVITQHEARKQNATNFKGSVISMSLAAEGRVSALDQAITAAIGAGIHVCVAAGNDGGDACSNSPSANGGLKGDAISVGSIDISGQKSSFSNYGSCVDVYAPGENVLSAGMHNPDLLAFLSGTSQATPHVTGLIAYAMANSTLASSPTLMKQYILSKGLPMGDGTVIANNGVDSSGSTGMLGVSKPAVEKLNFIANTDGLRVASPVSRLMRRHVET